MKLNQIDSQLIIDSLEQRILELETENKKLFASEQKYRVLFETLPIGVTLADEEGKIIDSNIAAERILGLSTAEQSQRKIDGVEWSIIRPDGTDMPAEEFASVRAISERRVIKNVEMGVQRGLEDTSWINVNAAPIDGFGVIISYEEITLQKNLKRQLLVEKQRLSYIIEGTNVGTWEWNIQTGAAIFSERWANIIGYTLEELSPVSIDTWRKFAHPDDLAKSSELLKKHFNGELDYYTCELRMKHKNGDWIWVLDSGKVHQWDHEGKPLLMSGTHQDISSRKQVEIDLKESKENFNNFFEVLEDIIVIASVDGIIRYGNKALPTKLGYTPEEFVKMHVLDLNIHSRRAEAEQIFAEMFRGEREFCPLPLQRKDGSLLAAETRVWLGKWNNEDCIFGIVKDLSHQQAALDKFQKIFDNNPNLMALSRLEDKVFTDVNNVFIEKLGYSREEVIGKTAFELNLFVDIGEQMSHAKNLSKGIVLNEAELQVRKKDGQILYGMFSGEIIDSQLEKSILTVMVDITALKKIEQLRRESEEHLTAVYNIIGSGIVLIDANSQIVLDVNKTAANLIGLPADEIIGKVCHRFICPNDIESCPMKSNARTIQDCEKILVCADGSTKDIFKTIIPIKYKGVDCYLESFMDITVLKKKENQLAELNNELRDSTELIESNLFEKNMLIEELNHIQAKLEESIITKDKFFTIIAHDLRSPFSGFMGLTDIMSKEIETLSIIEIKDMAKALNDASNTTFKLLSDLLEWSRFQTGSMPFNPDDYSIAYIIRNVVESAEIRARSKQITIDTSDCQEVICNFDMDMITTVVRNLISNAIKFSEIGGQIRISTKLIGTELIVSIDDNGVGIPAKIIPELFKIDSQISTLGTQQEKGTGIGLVLCREFIEKHKGRIWVESELGKGSTFSFSLSHIW